MKTTHENRLRSEILDRMQDRTAIGEDIKMLRARQDEVSAEIERLRNQLSDLTRGASDRSEFWS